MGGLVLLGAWGLVIGYGLMYTGIAKLSGVPSAQATLRQAFTRNGISHTSGGAADLNPPGITQAAAVQQTQLQQQATIPGAVLT